MPGSPSPYRLISYIEFDVAGFFFCLRALKCSANGKTVGPTIQRATQCALLLEDGHFS